MSAAVCDGGRLYLRLAADQSWNGRLVFDRPRHKLLMHLPLDYTRINQFPEWFAVEAEATYRVSGLEAQSLAKPGAELARGLGLETASNACAWTCA